LSDFYDAALLISIGVSVKVKSYEPTRGLVICRPIMSAIVLPRRNASARR